MNTKLLVLIYLVILAFTSLYLPEYRDVLIQYNETLNQLMKNSSTAFITKGS